MSDEPNTPPNNDDKPQTVAYESYQKLLGQKKSQDARLAELEAKAARLSEYEEREKALEEERAKKNGEFEKLEKQYKERISATESRLQSEVINNRLQDALNQYNIAPQYRKAAIAMLKSEGISLDDNLEPKIGTDSLVDYIANWAKTDEGKAFIAAPQSAGGGSNGGSIANNQTIGNMGGSKEERMAAINAKYKQ